MSGMFLKPGTYKFVQSIDLEELLRPRTLKHDICLLLTGKEYEPYLTKSVTMIESDRTLAI